MIRIDDLNNYITSLVTRITGLNHSLLVIDDDEFAGHLKDLQPNQMPILLAAYPSANAFGNSIDNVKYANVTLFYILKQNDRSSRTITQTLAQRQALQDLTLLVEKQLKADAVTEPYSCGILKDLDVNSIAIDPERNLADCEGWSIGFKFNTK